MTEVHRQAEPSTTQKQAPAAAHLVVIGSSAGGIEALSALVEKLPVAFAAPIVIAQHLDPTRPSQLQEILARRSALPVRLVDRRAALEVGHVYVVPANQDVEILDGWIALKPATGASKPSVDLLFSSAAAAYGQNLVAVVLTGTGSDGAIGARAVHEAGGTVVIQNPDTAAFPGMPRSLAPAIVDAVADLDELGPLLQSILTGSYVAQLPEQERELRTLLDEIREHRGVDFSRYQRPTIVRRLQRRLTATQSQSVAQYREYLKAHPEEEEHLIGSLLINVTDFFRDAQTFAYLRDHVLPTTLAAARERHTELRVWSAGCASGEEAYSLAILIDDLLSKPDRDHVTARIFATDVDADAIAFARRGVYPVRSLVNVPPDVLERAFVARDGEYEVTKPIRDLVIFGEHDLGRSAPFRQMDLVVCRNVLMYFTPELQKRALQAFAFSLRDEGWLVLGNAESTRSVAEYFSTDQSRLRVYRRNSKPTGLLRIASTLPSSMPPFTAATPLVAPEREPFSAIDRSVLALRPAVDEVLQELPIGVVIVTRQYDIELINTMARRLLGIHGLAAGQDVLHLLSSMSTFALQDAIDAAFKGEQPITLEEVATTEMGLGERTYLQITCVPRRERPTDGITSVMIVVNDVTTLVSKSHQTEEARARAEEDLQRLRGLIEKLGETNRKLLAANEALAAAEQTERDLNEEYLAANLQAQASAEELETYNEELQATNEEMETLNEELKSANQELLLAINDLDARSSELAVQRAASEELQAELTAFFAAIPDALVVVDRSGSLIRTNLAYDALLLTLGGEFVARDASGQPLTAEATPYARTARGENFSLLFTVRLVDGSTRWLQALASPIRANHVTGGLVLMRDVTDLRTTD